jgi:hypothetical protein
MLRDICLLLQVVRTNQVYYICICICDMFVILYIYMCIHLYVFICVLHICIGTSLERWDGKGAHPFPVLVQSDGGELLTIRCVIYVCIYMYKCAYTCIYMHTNIYIYMCVYVYVYIFIHIQVQ